MLSLAEELASILENTFAKELEEVRERNRVRREQLDKEVRERFEKIKEEILDCVQDPIKVRERVQDGILTFTVMTIPLNEGEAPEFQNTVLGAVQAKLEGEGLRCSVEIPPANALGPLYGTKTLITFVKVPPLPNY